MHVWRVDLEQVGDRHAKLLSPEERARAAGTLKPREGQLWSRSRGVLRALLGRYLGTCGATLSLHLGEHGKPSLEGPLSFNLSHSGATALYAISQGLDVGVDVELLGRPRDAVALAARLLGAADAERISGLGAAERQAEFLRLWVRHESRAKCLGGGLGGAGSLELENEGTWGVELDIGPGAFGAVAANRRPEALCCWEWAES